jgi:hypothetical protein
MKRVYKYTLALTDVQLVKLPIGSRILSCQMQLGILTMWALVSPGNDTEDVPIYIFGTGHDMPPNIDFRFIDTVQEGNFVWHIFELDC